MTAPRTPPAQDDILAALADALEAGLAPSEALALVARAGPTAARSARILETALGKGALAPALLATRLIGADDLAVVTAAETAARLPSALRWVAVHARQTRERRTAVSGAVVGPLLLAALSLLAEPLPSLILGKASFGPALGHAALLVGGAALVLFGLPRIWSHPWVRARATRLPFVTGVLQLEDENKTASVVAAFASSSELGSALPTARIVAPSTAAALDSVAKDPFAPVPLFSESFALALTVGARVGDLPARMAKWQAAAAERLTTRLRAAARIGAYLILVIVVVQSAVKLMSGPLPGLGDVNSPEMRELERELDSAGH